MTLDAGTQLGPYRIESAIGSGGMGEVHRARDTRLDRIVAIKVLPKAFASDPQFRERFDREARTISTLNHPHICTLHDVGTQDGVAFLVMEYLEGQTLADRLQKGPLAVDDTLRYALQIADALDTAHRSGIVHRDLKPGNVMLTKSGAKLLDFGLAKLADGTIPSGGETRLMSTARAAAITSQGTLLGTFQYMAPEQLEGQEADARADLWAFGCVLYEMATGTRAFDAKTQASLIASILERQPRPMAELQPMTPPAFERIVRTLLAKDREERFQSAFDVALQLKWVREGESAAPAVVIARRRPRERIGWLCASLVLASAAGLAGWWLKPAPHLSHVVSRFEYALPEGQMFTRTGRHLVAISPDGTKIVYVANQQLYLRALDQLDAQPIAGTNEDPLEPVFSPDGHWIAYFVPVVAGSSTATALRKVPVSGGGPVTLCQLKGPPFGANWRNGLIAFGQFVPDAVDAIEVVSESGGTPRILASVDPKDGRASQPQLLDDGTHLLFALIRSTAGTTEGQIVVQNLDGGSRRVLVNGGTNPQVVSEDRLVYAHDDTILGVPFDAGRLTVTGGPVSLLEHVMTGNTSGAGQFAVSRNGTLVYVPLGPHGSKRVLVWVDRESHETPIAMPPRTYTYPRLSPDGTRIVVTTDDDDSDVWIWDLERETPLRLTFGPAVELYATWTPDGRHIVFRSQEGSRLDLFRKPADGTGAVEALTTNGRGGEPLSISPDGKQLVYRTGIGLQNNDLMLLPLDGSGGPKPLLADPKFNERNGEISPDGRWIAYESDESGHGEVYVRPFPNVDAGRWPISSGGGTRPAWARSGRELFFESGNPGQFMAVQVQPGATFTYGKPRALFDFTPYWTIARPGRDYDVASDGRVLVTRPLDKEATRAAIVVVSQWIDEVQTRVK